MPITKSAQKSLRRDLRRKAHNDIHKARFRRLIKKFRKLILAQQVQKAQELLPQVFKALDKAAKEKVIKKGQADRRKSRLARLLAKMTDER